MTKRILFVDDEPLLLKGLERSLRGMRKEWEMEFVLGGPQALDAMGRRPFDVVISDMRMPGMDGAKLLELVKEHFSQTVRMVLSGQSDKDAVFRAIRPAHQYLSKPCDIEELKQKLKCALARRDDEAALGAARQAAAALIAYLDVPTPGAWRDARLADGGWRQDPAPASSAYHIVGALQALIGGV